MAILTLLEGVGKKKRNGKEEPTVPRHSHGPKMSSLSPGNLETWKPCVKESQLPNN